jgi:hypothetical protein
LVEQTEECDSGPVLHSWDLIAFLAFIAGLGLGWLIPRRPTDLTALKANIQATEIEGAIGAAQIRNENYAELALRDLGTAILNRVPNKVP